jgi:threonine dehydrogenase-like Zn-dependent dehydrogenase
MDRFPDYMTRTQMERYAILRELAAAKVVVDVRNPTRIEQAAASTTRVVEEEEEEVNEEDNNG